MTSPAVRATVRDARRVVVKGGSSSLTSSDGHLDVAAEGCAGGQFVGVPEDASRQSPCDWHRELPVVTLPPRERTA